ncbi:MAG: hypothetical protein MJZ91_02645 [Bacteroidales bacterium]|nr:hypothetical protein [Bacteroidales bacterium]
MKRNVIAADRFFCAAALSLVGFPQSDRLPQYNFAKTIFACLAFVSRLFARCGIVVRKPNHFSLNAMAVKRCGFNIKLNVFILLLTKFLNNHEKEYFHSDSVIACGLLGSGLGKG